jgi:hypothetical protein
MQDDRLSTTLAIGENAAMCIILDRTINTICSKGSCIGKCMECKYLLDTASPSRQTTNTAVDLPKEGKDQIRPSPVNLPSGERVLKTDKVIHRLIQDCCRSPEKREEKNLAKNDWMIRRHCPYKKDMLVYSTHGRGRRRNRQRAQ